MSKTYRVRTQVGVDRQINLQIDQDFEQLEILSLKVRSEEVYTRMCADYGVIVGRVVANGGYGVPNVRVSVFIPISEEDLQDPIISDLYPYQSLTDLNVDGYRYNLLPYEQQHTGHVPTGTFPSKNDVLTNPALIEVYDKYYKFTVKTNGSGDYMILGVPVGAHTVIMDMDLSDIGPFSLSPQDLIRMGIATPDQFDGVNFKSSTNLFELPQIVTLNQSVNVQPFWGQPEICQISIARHDFDLRQNGIDIQPTATFMGSLVTGIPDKSISKNCKPPTEMGNLCNLEVGPGEIVAVRQTIFQDTDGLPILEQAPLPQGGKVIDEDGTWVLEVPMNMDYVTTNEFGEQITSPDPTVGVPTKGKYRFKIKYSQPSNFETKEVRRAYFLVPNVKEYGWSTSDNDPAYEPYALSTRYQDFIGSYYFGLDWSGYTNQQDAIDCKDTFYEFQYNKVYTVAGLIDQYKKGTNRGRFIGIKEITDSECASENNRFPATDGVRNFDFFAFLVNNVILPINTFALISLVPVVHVIALIWPILRIIIGFVFGVVLSVVRLLCQAVNLFRSGNNKIKCPQPFNFSNLFNNASNPFQKITLPMLSYPDCQACDCKPENVPQDNDNLSAIQEAAAQNSRSLNADFFMYDNWNTTVPEWQETFAGAGFDESSIRVPIRAVDNNDYDFINNLPPWEVVNKFNLKSKYFDTDTYAGSNRIKVQVNPIDNPTKSHYDNLMVVFVDPDTEQFTPAGQLLTFQELTLSKDPNISGATSGTTTGITGLTDSGKSVTISYANPANPTQNLTTTYNFPSSGVTELDYKFPTDVEYFQVITGLTYNEFVTLNATNVPQSSSCTCITYNIQNLETVPITIDYTDCLGVAGSIEIGVDFDTTLQEYYGLSDEICACQGTITSTGNYNITFQTACTPPSNPALVLGSSLYAQLNKQIKLFRKDGKDGAETYSNYLSRWIGGDIRLVFMVRGVDPHSGRKKIKYDLSRILGYNTYGYHVVEGQYYMNVPIQSGLKTVRHSALTNNLQTNNGGYLYFNSYQYSAGTQYSAYTSTLQSYYSALDSSQINVYKIDSSDNDTILSNSMVGTGSYGQLQTLTQTTPSNVGYGTNEYIEGGTFIWYEDANITKVNGNDNNDRRPRYYFSPSWARYSPGSMLVYKDKMVMRSDRLPVGTILDGSLNNFFAWQSSNALPYILVSDEGTAVTQVTGPTFSYGDTTAGADVTTGGTMNKVLTSFDCTGMVDLDCYQGYGQSFTVLPANNPCNTNAGGQVVKNGCYVLVNKPIVTLFGRNNDFELLSEWVSRFRVNFAICRGVLSHTFVNSWVNGTLFAFPFKSNVFFDDKNRPFVRRVIDNGSLADPRFTVDYTFCADVIAYEPNSNNFYYRSSPWNNSSKQFIGKDSPTSVANDVNVKNLLFPTTVVDLGPKFIWTKDVVLSPDYYGYQMDEFQTSSWNDESDLLQLFVISRLVNANYLESIVGAGDASVRGFFSRNEQRVDGDYAQMIQINSQYGIVPFNSENYVDTTGSTGYNPIYVSVDDDNNSVFGVFYSGFTQERDLISPRRIDRTTTGSTSSFVADYLGTKSQVVPFYRWTNTGWGPNAQPSIFGNEENTWYTTGNAYKNNYQSIDRLQAPMFIGNSGQIQNLTGYIYNRNFSGQYVTTQGNTTNYTTLTSAPWYFYFGLKTGRSAMDKFRQLYINTEEQL